MQKQPKNKKVPTWRMSASISLSSLAAHDADLPQPIEINICGTATPMMKLASHMTAVARPTPFARRELGKISAGSVHANGPYEQAKQRM